MSRNEIWEKYRDPDCKDCGIWRSAQEVCLMGDGPTDADIIIIGEAPGKREDDIGKPFAGKSGTLLNNLLAHIDLGRKDCFITNVVKCRPANNRTPTKTEMKTCRQYLEKEIQEVDPDYGLLLGATALEGVTNEKGITKKHGKVFNSYGVTFLATFHPALALRDPGREPDLRTDFERFKKLIEGNLNVKPELKMKIVNSRDEFKMLQQDLKKSRAVSFDLETTQLDMYAEGREINCLGLATSRGHQWVLPLQHPMRSNKKENIWYDEYQIQQEMLVNIRDILKKTETKVIAHNAKFDNKWLRAVYKLRFPVTFDTMLASHLLDENSPNGLKYLASRKLNAPDYDIDDKTKRGEGGNPEKLYKYCALDVYYTLELYKIFREKILQDRPTAKIMKYLVMPLSDALEDVEETGVFVDTDQFEKVEKRLKFKMEEAEEEINQYYKKHAGIPEDKQVDINWNSPQQIAEVLFDDLNIDIVETTKTGNPSTKESVLKEIDDPISDLILEYRGIHKQYSTYIKGWKKRMINGKLHPKFKIHGTVTYRLSCTNPNLQQVPRDPVIRSLIGAPNGWTFVEADYSQAEMRIAAICAKEKTMEEIFREDEDIHTKTAQAVTGKDEITKYERKKAKAVGFGFLYGMGAHKFKDYAKNDFGIELTLDEAKKYRQRFFDTYSALPQWHKRQMKLAKAKGQVRSLLGRVRRLPGIYSNNYAIKSNAERQAINFPVQSFASDLTDMGLVEIWRNIPEYKCKIVGEVHDAVLMVIKDEYLEEVIQKVKYIMENLKTLEKFNLDLPIPMEVDIEVGNWGSGIELEFDDYKLVDDLDELETVNR